MMYYTTHGSILLFILSVLFLAELHFLMMHCSKFVSSFSSFFLPSWAGAFFLAFMTLIEGRRMVEKLGKASYEALWLLPYNHQGACNNKFIKERSRSKTELLSHWVPEASDDEDEI